MTDNPKVEKIINEMRANGNLPALSENVRDICRIARQTHTCAVDLAAVIMRDAGLTSNILSEANSSYYSPRYPIKTITFAVSFLGFDKVYSMALGLSLFKQTMKSAKTQTLLQLYASSYFSGAFAQSLARESAHKNSEEIFVAGLLYRLPWIALANTYPEKFKQMEDLVRNGNQTHDAACNKIFEVDYTDICESLCKLYNLPPTISDVILEKQEGNKQLSSLVRQAGHLSNMLFGNKLGGKDALEKLDSELKELLNKKDFSVSDFIKNVCKNDHNVKQFFNMDKSDVDMMVSALEWGKGNPAQITSRTAGTGELQFQEEREEEDPERLIGHFLTELMMGVKKASELNQMIMLAQEALYRCLGNPEVFTCFFNKKKTILTGRFYVGNRMDINAEDFFININHTDSPIIQAIQNQKNGEWNTGDNSSLHLPLIRRHINLKCAIFAPIIALGHPIGLYFVGRIKEEPFTEREKIWLEQISFYVSSSFEKTKKDTSPDYMVENQN
jgi:HD-like signal output (HDOD) protein